MFRSTVRPNITVQSNRATLCLQVMGAGELGSRKLAERLGLT